MATEVETAMVRAERVILVCDLAGFKTAFDDRADDEMAAFLEAYYAAVGAAVEDAGGRLVKLIGDAVLSVYPADGAGDAVGVAIGLEGEIDRLAADHGVAVEAGADVHRGTVLEGELGHGSLRRPDVIGRAVNHAFRLGQGSGVRVSEEVRRALPAEERAHWRAGAGPGVYTRSDDRPRAPGGAPGGAQGGVGGLA